MNKRPLAVTLIALLYVVVGVAGVAYHFPELKAQQADSGWVELTSFLALVSGVFLFLRRNWARWLALAWIAFHVVISAFQNLREFGMHVVICAVISYFLFRPESGLYFRSGELKRIS
jgi:uncharacterized membrane protein HdeD (DUF308 family)